MDHPARIAELASRWLNGTITPEEEREFAEWYNRFPDDVVSIAPSFAKSVDELRRKSFAQLEKKISQEKRIYSLKTGWLRYAAAVIIVTGTFAYLWNYTQKENSRNLSLAEQSVPVNNDVQAPVANRATITLSTGKRIFADSAQSGTLARDGKATIEKRADGRIVYSETELNGEPQYNTLTNPRGSRVASIVLSDGTVVFLNAESSLTYPVSFSGKERKVEVTGEAYFEVAKDAKRKFIVTSGDLSTEVLGTHFNVNAYPDEQTVKVTLLEGGLRIHAGATRSTIKPGDQAAIVKHQVNVQRNVDLDQVMAWKNGTFNFSNAKLDEAIRQMARWYDVTVVYDHGIPSAKLAGEMGRTLSLQQVLKGLEGIAAHFKLEGRTLHVLPLSEQ